MDQHALYLEIVVHKTEIKTLFVDEDSNNWSQSVILENKTCGTLPGASPFLKMVELITFDQNYSNRSQKFSTKCNRSQNSELSLLEVLNITENKILSYTKQKY